MTMAGFAAVSHCYLRPTYPDWPYNVFTMVHGRNVDECTAILESIAEKTGIREMKALYSTREYKKVRVSYFTPETYAGGGSTGARPGLTIQPAGGGGRLFFRRSRISARIGRGGSVRQARTTARAGIVLARWMKWALMAARSSSSHFP